MSKFDLRDISERLATSRNTEAVLFEFLGYLQSVRSDWRASVAFYEVSRDAIVNVYQRDANRLQRRDLSIQVERLPARLVRKFFHPSAFFNHGDRGKWLTQLFQSSPYYELSLPEAHAMGPVSPMRDWQSAVCLPLADQDDILGLLMIASSKKGAFGSKEIASLLPLKATATLAISQHLHRAPRPETTEAGRERDALEAARRFQQQMQVMTERAAELERDNADKARRVEALGLEIESLDKNSSQYRLELDRVKGELGALEAQSALATEHLTEAYAQLDHAQNRLGALNHTMGFLREVCQVLSQEHDRDEFARTMVACFSQHFGVERCSLMTLDATGEALHMAACVGVSPEIARQVRVRIGQGIAGWVAHNRKPLFVRMREQEQPNPHTGQDAYNSDSFICVPLVHNNRLFGVMNLSNKRDGESFDEHDLDRALIAGSLVAMTLGQHEAARRAAAWV